MKLLALSTRRKGIVVFSHNLSVITALVCGLASLSFSQSQPAPGPSKETSSEENQRKYLPQHQIDSLVNLAFYTLTEASSTAGFGFRQNQGIQSARRTARLLRELAEEDPNKKYILWKVGELEAQIFLEEQEIRQKRTQEKQRMINRFVDLFNAEIGKKRPAFHSLDAIREQMSAVDPQKSDQLRLYIEDRSRNIAREVAHSVQKALNARKQDLARRELDYINTNMAFLRIPITTYGKLSGKLRASVDLDKERDMIARGLEKARNLLAHDSLGQAMNACIEVRSRLAAVRSSFSRGEWTRHSIENSKTAKTVEQKEDLLVRKNLDILENMGIDAAIDYLDNVLKGKHAVSRQKTVAVNNAIIALILARRTEQDTTISPELRELVDGDDENGLDFDQMAMAAKKRAKEKADSILAEEQKNRKRNARSERRRQRKLAKKRRNEAEQQSRLSASEEERTQRQKLKAIPEESLVPTTPEFPSPVPDNRSNIGISDAQGATEKMIEIYMLIEQNEAAQARTRFAEHREALQAHLIPEAFETLRQALGDTDSE